MSQYIYKCNLPKCNYSEICGKGKSTLVITGRLKLNYYIIICHLEVCHFICHKLHNIANFLISLDSLL